MKEGRTPKYPEKTPGDKLQEMPHTSARRLKPQARLEPVQWHWCKARKAEMLTATPHVAPNTDEIEQEQATSPAIGRERSLFTQINICTALKASLGGPLRGWVEYILSVPHQNGISQACYLVEIYHSGLEPICHLELKNHGHDAGRFNRYLVEHRPPSPQSPFRPSHHYYLLP